MHTIDLDYNWKSAAAEESVDYQAVESTFMTQAYGFVANKAKVLFRDPFRLGFEIVHRNEKATKMVGIFAFRCNNSLLYAPVFFVNGEIKGADMLYRSEVKRFVPLSDDWCSFLVRGANEESGNAQRKGMLRRQPDSNMYRLAYPQRTKYAGEFDASILGDDLTEVEKAAAEGIFREMMLHSAQDDNVPNLLPRAIQDGGPAFLTKLANLIEGSDIASRYVAENYTTADLTLDPDWCVKKAAANAVEVDPLDRYRGSVVLVRELGFAKSAADRKGIAERGYALEDYRELGAVNAVTDYIEDPAIHELTSTGVASVMDTDGESFDALILKTNDQWMQSRSNGMSSIVSGGDDHGNISLLTLGGKVADYVTFRGRRSAKIIGQFLDDKSSLDKCFIKPSAAKADHTYILVHKESLHASEPFVVTGKDGKAFKTTSLYGSNYADLLFQAAAAEADPARGFVNDAYALIEIKTEKKDADRDDVSTVWTKNLMAPAQLDAWLRTGGGNTHSKDITVTTEPTGLFSISAEGSDGFRKIARSLSRMEAHLSLAGDYEMRVDKAGEILDFTEDKGAHRFRLYDTVSKSGYTTQMHPEREWITGYDPILNARYTSPQQQTLGTTTPVRAEQHHRIGDRYMGEAPTPSYDPEEDGLPPDAIMQDSPEQLAALSQKYDLPHIFDHQVIGNLAGNTYDTIEQVRQYVPDLETGVDRYARILFLLRYRPADFEEAYGKDELMEMEQELTSLFSMAGETLLRMLKRFDNDKFSPQSDS